MCRAATWTNKSLDSFGTGASSLCSCANCLNNSSSSKKCSSFNADKQRNNEMFATVVALKDETGLVLTVGRTPGS